MPNWRPTHGSSQALILTFETKYWYGYQRSAGFYTLMYALTHHRDFRCVFWIANVICPICSSTGKIRPFTPSQSWEPLSDGWQVGNWNGVQITMLRIWWMSHAWYISFWQSNITFRYYTSTKYFQRVSNIHVHLHFTKGLFVLRCIIWRRNVFDISRNQN